MFGVRINLDDVERTFLVAAVARDDQIHVFAQQWSEEDRQVLRSTIAEWLGTNVRSGPQTNRALANAVSS